MHKPKPYKCPVCGQEIPNLPMPVLKHQLSHAKPRPYARDRPVEGEGRGRNGSGDGRHGPDTSKTDSRSS